MSFEKPEKTTSSANVVPHKSVMRYQCAAHQCPMPGSVSGEGWSGVCAYHYGTHGTDWPRITQALLDWVILSQEVEHCRRLHCDPANVARPDVLEHEYHLAVQRVMRGAGTWADEIKPGTSRSGQPESYQAWVYRLECFLGQRVVECLSRRIGRTEAAPSKP
jgi:hypothetical protein